MSLKRMWLSVCAVSKESHKWKLAVFFDMLWCAVKYNIGYLEYQVFGFAHVRGKKRKTFMTMNYNLALIRRVNDKRYTDLFEDKIQFNQRFKEYIGREFLDLNHASAAEFGAFLQGKEYVFAKECGNFGGQGVERLEVRSFPDVDKLYHQLKNNKQYLVEEQVVQDERMNALCPSSVNTIRIVTLLVGQEAHVMYSLVRMGNGKKAVDNISSGGIYCAVPSTGIITKPGFCDKTAQYYEVHPFTGTRLIGFEIPRYQEAVELVKRAALEVPQVRYVGWDVAISTKGPVLIEGNTIPGYDMCQNYYHLEDDKCGILPKFQQVLALEAPENN